MVKGRPPCGVTGPGKGRWHWQRPSGQFPAIAAATCRGRTARRCPGAGPASETTGHRRDSAEPAPGNWHARADAYWLLGRSWSISKDTRLFRGCHFQSARAMSLSAIIDAGWHQMTAHKLRRFMFDCLYLILFIHAYCFQLIYLQGPSNVFQTISKPVRTNHIGYQRRCWG